MENSSEMIREVDVGRGVVARTRMKIVGLGSDEANVVLQVGW